VSATALAGRVANAFLPSVDLRAQPKGPVATAGVDVSGRAGLYFDERTDEPMRLGVSNGRLMIANGPPLVPVTAERFRPPRPDMFFRSNDDFELRFADPDHIEIKSMEGQVTRYRRAQAWTPTAADLQAVDGRYESTELGSVFEVVPGTDKLVMRFESAPERSLELTPVERDTYMLRMMIVRFQRDASGKVTGFVYGNPVVSNLVFTRLGDRKAVASASGAAAPPSVNKVPVVAATAPATPGASASAAPRLEGLTGEYELAPGRTLAITLEGGRLLGQPPGGEKRLLTHDSGTTFAAAGSAITLTFTLGTDGSASAVMMRQNGRERTLPKVR
jgi:hypothetical protein